MSSVIVVEAPDSTWLFDAAAHCFRHVTKAPSSGDGAEEWRSYDHLVIDDTAGIFLVFLNASGTRVLRSRGKVSQRDCLGDFGAVEAADGEASSIAEQSRSPRSRLVEA
jgi:hypothetical protein